MKQIISCLAVVCSTFFGAQTAQSANECLQKKDFACAEEQFTTLAQKERIQKLKSQYYVNLGIAQRNLGKLTLAMKSFEAGIQFSSDNSTAYEQLGLSYAQKGQKAQAIEYVSKGLKGDVGDIALYLLRARMYAETQKPELAVKDLTTVLDMDPGNIFAMSGLAEVKAAKGNYSEAIKEYDALLKDKQEPLFFVGRSQVYHKMKKYKEALADANKAISINPNFSPSYVAKGNALLSSRRKTEACSAFQKSLSLGYEKYFINEQLEECAKKD